MITEIKVKQKDVKNRFEKMIGKYFGYSMKEETIDRIFYEVVHFTNTKKLDLLIDAFAYAFEELTFYVFATDSKDVSQVRINF